MPVSPLPEDLRRELIKETCFVLVPYNYLAQWCPWLYYQSTQEEGAQWKAHQESCSLSRIQHQAHCELLLYGIERENGVQSDLDEWTQARMAVHIVPGCRRVSGDLFVPPDLGATTKARLPT